jgi:hypothetical protein
MYKRQLFEYPLKKAPGEVERKGHWEAVKGGSHSSPTSRYLCESTELHVAFLYHCPPLHDDSVKLHGH